MATLALSLGGALAGNLIGGPLGGRVGFLAGQFLGNQLFGNADDKVVEGPRLTDLTVTSSAYGRPIPIVYGRFRVGGNVVWSPGIAEHRQEQTVGGKGGGPAQTTLSYRYTADFRVALCEGPADAVLRVWADGKLIADFTGPTPVFAGKVRQGNLRIHLGAETQEADPAEQADRGIDDTPAYRGQVGIVFDDLPLEDFGNRIPQITAEVAIKASDSFPVASAAAFASPVTQLARWSADRRFLFTLSAGGTATKWDAVNKRQLVGASVGVGEAFCPALDSEGNLYTTDGNGGLVKFDDNWRQIGVSPTAMSQDFVNLIVAGRPGFERAVAQGVGDKVGTFSTTTLQLLDEVALSAFAAPTAGSYQAFADRNGMTLDGEGFVWTLVVDGQADGYLFKIDPGIGTVLERHVLAGKKDARFLSYDPASNSLIVEDNGAAGLLRFSLDSLSVDATLSLSLDATVDNRSQYCAGPVDGRLWLQGTLGAVEVDTIAFQVARSVSVSDWPGVPTVEQMVYDPVNHALVWLDVIPPTLYWLFLDRKAGLPVPLGDIVDDISARVGLDAAADLDTAALTDSVVGYVISDRMAARAALEPLATAYFFDAREEDFKVDFVTRGGAPVADIPEADLGARGGGQEGFVPLVGEERVQEIELPRRIDMTYADPAIDFQTSTQFFQRIQEAVATRKRSTINMPLALDAAEAARRIERIGFQLWQARTPYELSLSRKHARISPADVVRATAKGVTFTLRVEQADLGANGVIRLRGVSEDAAVYASAATGAAALGVPAQSIVLSGPSALHLLDTPLLRDADEGLGLYVAAGAFGAEPWPGAAIFKSNDGADFGPPFTFISAARNAAHGRTETALGDHGTRTWDRTNAVSVRLFRGALASATELAVLNGANALLIGDEVVQFANATLNADGGYTLDTFLRGRRGTEWATGAHAAGERVVVLSDATLLRVALPDADLNVQRFYKAVTVGGLVGEGTQKALTFQGRALMPYAPVHIGGAPSGSPAHWTITWVRRTRLGGAWKDGADVPLGEESEDYEVDILNGAAVARTITSTASPGGSVVTAASRQALYTAADQIADFGAEQATLTLKVYQLSATVGRGFPGAATLAA
ncbi:MAG: phage tail protein [Kiloniellaceae bacterium]